MSNGCKRLSDKKVFVTGGSRGIGAAIVKLLASEGAQVAFTYSSNEAAAQEILKSLPGEGHFILKMDLNSEESINQTSEQVLNKFQTLDGLVNNAGLTKDQLLLRMKTSDFDDVINANLRGTFLLTKNIIKSMLKNRKGSVVNITSVIGRTGNAGQANYAASKAGLMGMSKSIALEIASRGIRVNCIAPGFIETDMTKSMSPESKESILKKIPLQSIGQGEDVAFGVVFLLSDESKYITGHTLDINGGMYMN